MLGSYLREQFADQEVLTLGLREESDFKFDLTREIPEFGENGFETVIHAAGSEEEEKALSLNLEGTNNLLKALEENPPENFVFISSYKVYSRDAGENVTEDTPTWASNETGRSKALAEDRLKDWCDKNDVTLTIIRPARMFGNGVKGETLRLFNDALTGKYIHIRGNDAKVSIVCALDVARAVKAVYEYGGIYNLEDGRPVKFLDLVEAMTANAGAKKRMNHLPAAWAEWVWRLGHIIPSIQRNLAPKVVEDRMKTLTLDGTKVRQKTGLNFFDTISVIERKDKNYPYEENKIQKRIHEV